MEVRDISSDKVIFEIFRVNGFKNGEKIELVKGKIEDTELPVDKVDIIISEWMGYFLLFENMLDSIVYARDHHLKQPGGIIMPNRFSLELLGASDMRKLPSIVTVFFQFFSCF